MLTEAQKEILEELERKSPQTLRDLSQHLKIQLFSLRNNVRDLIFKGLASWDSGASLAEMTSVSITPKGTRELNA